MIEDQLGRCVASWYKGATGVTGAAKLSGGASQETWTFDILHPSGNVGAILRRAPPGYGASPGRAAGLDAEAVLMQLAHDFARRAVCHGSADAGTPARQGRGRHSWAAAGKTAKASHRDVDERDR